MKKKVIMAFTIIVVCIIIFHTGLVVGAGSKEPGSSGDPLITKSYLEERLKTAGKTPQVSTKVNVSYNKISLKKGKTLFGTAGTEMIVYSGSGTVVGKNGLINLSSGELFSKGNTIVKYSAYLSTKADCGIKASGDSIIFIRGKYKIK